MTEIMSEQQLSETKELDNKKVEETTEYATNFDSYSVKDQAIIYLLWKIQTKKIGIGSMIFYEELDQKFKLPKGQWNLVKEFLSGANLVVNQVVIQGAVSKELINRFGLLNE